MQIRIILRGVFAAPTPMIISAALAPLHRVGITALCSAVTFDLERVVCISQMALTAIAAGVAQLSHDGWRVTILPGNDGDRVATGLTGAQLTFVDSSALFGATV